MDDPPLPLFKQLRMGQRHRPQRREKQQAAPMDVLPQPRQATGEKTVGLLGRVLADQLQLAQDFGDL
ncbi:hypothetical protein D3C84_1185620 [compost metagenome]